jgi:hypothetical protein
MREQRGEARRARELDDLHQQPEDHRADLHERQRAADEYGLATLRFRRGRPAREFVFGRAGFSRRRPARSAAGERGADQPVGSRLRGIADDQLPAHVDRRHARVAAAALARELLQPLQRCRIPLHVAESTLVYLDQARPRLKCRQERRNGEKPG